MSIISRFQLERELLDEIPASADYLSYVPEGLMREALKSVSRARTRPFKVAGRLNTILDNRFGDLHYEANATRVFGVYRELKEVEKNFPIPYWLVLKNGFELFGENYFGVIYSSVSRSVNALYPYFIAANDMRISDSEFGRVVKRVLYEEYYDARKRIRREGRRNARQWIAKMVDSALKINWRNQLKRDYFSQILPEQIDLIEKTDLRFIDIYKANIGKDLDLDEDFRKAMLGKWMSDRWIRGHNNAVKKASEEMEQLTRLLAEQKRKHAPRIIIKNLEDAVGALEFISDILMTK